MIRTENISESEEQRMNKKIFKRAVAMMMAAVLTVGAALPSSNVCPIRGFPATRISTASA